MEGTRAKPPLKGEVPAKRAEGFVPHAAQVAAALSAAVTTPQNRKARARRMGAQVRRKNQAYSQPLFGREREGGASLREAASLAESPYIVKGCMPHPLTTAFQR